jgi:tetratricopeptide (TPR) repeat protein
LLAYARQALDNYRLVTPEGDNAYEYLSTVLRQDPENATARAGIEEIVVIYRTLATDAVENNEFERAGRYLDRALRIQPANPDLLALKDTIERSLETPPVTATSATPVVQLTHDDTTLRQPPSLKKRQAADRRLDIENF